MLDRKRPYAQVFGMDGVAWYQDGRAYNYQGELLDEQGRVVRAEPEPIATGDGIDGMHWKQLKVAVEQYGEVYTTPEAARNFLRGRA